MKPASCQDRLPRQDDPAARRGLTFAEIPTTTSTSPSRQAKITRRREWDTRPYHPAIGPPKQRQRVHIRRHDVPVLPPFSNVDGVDGFERTKLANDNSLRTETFSSLIRASRRIAESYPLPLQPLDHYQVLRRGSNTASIECEGIKAHSMGCTPTSAFRQPYYAHSPYMSRLWQQTQAHHLPTDVTPRPAAEGAPIPCSFQFSDPHSFMWTPDYKYIHPVSPGLSALASAAEMINRLQGNESTLKTRKSPPRVSPEMVEPYRIARHPRLQPKQLSSRVIRLSHFLGDEIFYSSSNRMIIDQLDLFEAGPLHMKHKSVMSRYKKHVAAGQVGLQCRHCSHLKPSDRGNYALFYPSSLKSLHSAAHSIASRHIYSLCQHVPDSTRKQIKDVRDLHGRGPGHGEPIEWAKHARALGLYETRQGLRLRE